MSERRVVDYAVLDGGDFFTFHEKVRDFLSEGWHLRGDVKVLCVDGDVRLFQVVVLYEDIPIIP